jgi:1,4-dihydroxy-2-naphthoate octaprenyltransferase
MSKQRIFAFLKLSRPLLALGVIVQSFLGLGISRYLGLSVGFSVASLAVGFVVFSALGGIYLFAHFHRDETSANQDWIALLLAGQYEYFRPGQEPWGDKLPPQTAILSAAVSFTIATLSIFGLINANAFLPVSIVLAILLLLIAVLFSSPGIALAYSGFGELALAIGLGALVPMFVYSVIAGEIHRLLPLVTLPLIFHLLSAFIIFQFPNYAEDQRRERQTLLQRMGWQNALFFNNSFLLLGFLSLALIPLTGVPFGLVLLPMFVLPLAGLQIWNLWRMAEGGTPNWLNFRLTALAIFGAVAYLLSYSFWVR